MEGGKERGREGGRDGGTDGGRGVLNVDKGFRMTKSRRERERKGIE